MRITGGVARGVPLVVPRTQRVRPTSDRVRSALFQLLGSVVVDARVLDLYAGTGALGIEALSRGAASVDFVEADPRVCDIVARNKKTAGFDECGRLYRTKVERALEFLTGPYQVVLLDPPYELPGIDQTMDKLAGAGLIETGSIVAVEHAVRVALAESYGALKRLDTRRYGDTAISLYSTKDA